MGRPYQTDARVTPLPRPTMFARLATPLLLLLLFTSFSLAAPPAPTVEFPLDAQRPPVGRVGTPFTFTFLPGTFNATGGALTLTTSALPAWATFSPSTQTISGTPTATSETQVVVSAVSTAGGESSDAASTSFDLLVVAASTAAPVLNYPLSTQLASGAVLGSAKYITAGKGSISVPMKWSWSIGLLPDTVTSPGGGKIYYTAYEQGTTSLPYWITFSSETLTFDGITPEWASSTTIVLFASDHAGYGDIQQAFTFNVADHSLGLTSPLPGINATASAAVNYTVPLNTLEIDGAPANSSEITMISVDLSNAPYLHYDAASHVISGTLPANASSSQNLSLPVTFESSSNDTVQANVTLRVLPSAFTAAVLPTLRLSPGQAFDLDLSQYVPPASTNATPTTYQIASVSPANATYWVSLANGTTHVNGTVPLFQLGYSNVTVAISALQNGAVIGSTSLPIYVSKGNYNPPGSSSPAGESSGSGSSNSGGSGGGHHGLSRKGKMALVGVFAGLGALILMIALLVCCRRYCEGRADDDDDDATWRPPEKSPISGTASPNSFATTLVGALTPKFKGDELKVGTQTAGTSAKSSPNPMLAVTPTEATFAAAGAMEGGHPGPMMASDATRGEAEQTGPKRFDMFNIFHGRVDPPKATPSRGSLLAGLGIAAADHRTVVVPPLVPGGATDADDELETGDDDEVEGETEDPAGLGLSSNSDDQRSTWNSNASSSLFYSDTPADDSEGWSSRSPERRRGPASIPRRRADFSSQHAFGPGDGQVSPSPSRPSRGGIRIISHQTTPSRYSEDIGVSESLGAIATAAVQKVTPPRGQDDGTVKMRPTLIPLSREGTMSRGTPSPSPTKRTSGTGSARRSADIAEDQRLSVYSGLYANEDVESPTASPIFFSTPREDGWRSPVPPAGTYPDEGVRMLNSTTPIHSPIPPRPERASADSTATLTQASASSLRLAGEPIKIHIAVGEPFHFAPSVARPSSTVSVDAAAPRSSYYALWDDDGMHRTLPEWIHFDGRELEVGLRLQSEPSQTLTWLCTALGHTDRFRLRQDSRPDRGEEDRHPAWIPRRSQLHRGPRSLSADRVPGGRRGDRQPFRHRGRRRHGCGWHSPGSWRHPGRDLLIRSAGHNDGSVGGRSISSVAPWEDRLPTPLPHGHLQRLMYGTQCSARYCAVHNLLEPSKDALHSGTLGPLGSVRPQ